jgi:glutamate-1-semialdehyde 2,1-aminomutase
MKRGEYEVLFRWSHLDWIFPDEDSKARFEQGQYWKGAMAAGFKMVTMLRHSGIYEQLEQTTSRLVSGLLALCREAGVPATANQVGSMFTLFFSGAPVTDYASAKRSDTAYFGRFFRGLLDRGVYLPPSQFEAAFVSAVHGGDIIDATLSAARAVLQSI